MDRRTAKTNKTSRKGLKLDYQLQRLARRAAAAAASGVLSFAGRVGIVIPQAGDYTAADVGADPTGTAAAGDAAHVAALDPHPQYLTAAEGNAAYAPLAHVGAGGAEHANVVAAGAAGFMTGADKTKLDGIAAGATAYTDAMARAAVVVDSIADADVDHAPSRNAVFDALALKQDLDSDLTAIAALAPVNDDIIQRKAGAWTNRTVLQLVADITATNTYQLLDATLTALAGANWAANAIPIGSGADALSQVSFAANTFPARSSVGNLVAKSISDDALAFLAAANDSAMRIELGATTVGANLYTLANPGAVTFVRINADNTVTTRSAANFRTDIGSTTVGDALFVLANPGAITFLRVNADNSVTARSAANFNLDLGLGTTDAVTFGSVLVGGGSVRIDRAGDATTGQFVIDVDAGQQAQYTIRTGTSNRWVQGKDGVAEAGADAGSDYFMTAYSDAGASLGNVYTIARATRILSFVVSPTAPTPAAGSNNTKVATMAAVRAAVNVGYHRIVDRTGSHTAGRTGAPSTYFIPMGDVCGIASTGTLYSAGAFYFDPADYPDVDGITARLRLRATCWVNDVAPGVTFTYGLHPVTNPATSGAAGVRTYNISAAVASSTAAIATPAADSGSNKTDSGLFTMPAAGMYVLGFVQSGGNTAASSHCHLGCQLDVVYA